jgi:hypothetical protein
MTPELFEQTLRDHKYRKSFLPLVVTLTNGRRIIIDQPGIVFDGNGAGFLSDEDGLIDFSREEVKRMEILTPEMCS